MIEMKTEYMREYLKVTNWYISLSDIGLYSMLK